MKKPALFVLKLTVSLSLLVYLFFLIDFDGLRDNFSGLAFGYIGLAFALLLGQSLLSATKWKTLLAAENINLKFLFLLRTYLISNFFSLFLPTSFGGDVYRVMAVRKAAGSTLKTASSVLFDRMSGLFALLSIACIGYFIYPQLPYKEVLALLYLAGLLMLWLALSGRLLPRLQAITNPLVTRITGVMRSFAIYGANRRCLLTVLLISFAFQFNIVVINKVYTLAFGMEVPFVTLLAIIPLIYLTEAIPLSVNGLGFRESAFVFFYQLIGETAEAGFAISLTVLVMRYTLGMVGGTLYLGQVLLGKTEELAVDSR